MTGPDDSENADERPDDERRDAESGSEPRKREKVDPDEIPPDERVPRKTADAGGQPTTADAGGQSNTANAGGQTEPEEAGGQGEPTRAGGQGESSKAGGQTEPAESGGRDSPERGGGQGEPGRSGGQEQKAGGQGGKAGGQGSASEAAGRADPTRTDAPTVEGEPDGPAVTSEPRAAANIETPEEADESEARERPEYGDETEVRERIEAALTEVRREGLKAAVIYAVVDGVALFLLVNFVLVLLDPAFLPTRVALPGSELALPGSALVGAAVGVAGGGGELWWRSQQSIVEQFEAVNPPVAESLRTARDAVAADANSRMAVRLYEDVLSGLRESSSVALVAWKRVGATLAVAVVVSLVTLQVAATPTAVFGPTVADNETREGAVQNYTGLKDGDDVLGAPEVVSNGSETRTARVESSGGGRELDDEEQFPGDVGAGGGGGGGDGSVDSQQAGFAAPDRVEDADLVREYNERIREDANADEDDS
ncbi:hypothetical protein BRC64_08565 [Halobacteriales archaeon QH_10_67_22]|nr:MAG: hypothetical protein BRC64_08565 [Halobacteriales archaeon QH_10_67_22]